MDHHELEYERSDALVLSMQKRLLDSASKTMYEANREAAAFDILSGKKAEDFQHNEDKIEKLAPTNAPNRRRYILENISIAFKKKQKIAIDLDEYSNLN